MLAVIPYFQVPQFSIGPFFGLPALTIHGFGVLVALGFIIGGNVAMKRAQRSGLDPEVINRLLGWLVVGTFVGGHVGYGLMYKPDEYMADPIKFLYVWEGLSSFGGFAVCVPLSFWFFYKERLKVWPYMDCIGIGLAFGWFLGRMGCTVAHDHPGPASNGLLAIACRPVEGNTIELPSFLISPAQVDLRWGPCLDQAGGAITDIANKVPADFSGIMAAHDTGFYEALWSLSVGILFLAMDRVARKPGVYICLLGVLYAPFRFWLDTMRPEITDARYMGFTPGQYWSTLLFAVAVWGLYTRLKSDTEPMGPSAPVSDEGRRAPAPA